MQRVAAIERPLEVGRQAWPALGFAAFLALYGNVHLLLPHDLVSPFDWAFVLRNAVIAAAALAWAIAVQRLSLTDLGLTTRNLAPSASAGAAVTLVVVVPAILYFLFPVGVPGGDIDYEQVQGRSTASFLTWALLRFPTHTAVFEEVMFRGVLQALGIRAFGVARGILLSAFTFAAWHIVVDYQTQSDTNVADSPAFFALAQVASLVALFGGGLIFSALRQRTGSLAGPIVFHWAAVAAMNATLFALSD